jgi:PAS domain S-box-containing protein
VELLVLCGEPKDLRLVQEKGWGLGCDVVAAPNAADAWTWLRHPTPPALAVLDLATPGLPLEDLYTWLEIPPPERRTLVLLISGSLSDPIAARALVAGADDLLLSPLDPALLEARLRMAIRTLALRQSAEAAAASARGSEEELRLARVALDNAAEAMFRVDALGEILAVNDTATRMLGYERDELVGTSIHALDVDYDPSTRPARWEELRRRRAVTFETRHRKRNGELLPVEVSVVLLELDGTEQACSLVRDISDRRRAETALRERVQAEALVAAVSSGLLAPALEEIDAAIVSALGRVASFFAADHAEIRELTQDGTRALCVHAWDALPSPAPETLPWTRAHLNRRWIRQSDELPEDFARERSLGARALAWHPVRASGRLVGGLSLLWRAHDPPVSEDSLEPLSVIGDAFFAVLRRKNTEEALRHSEQRLELALWGADLGLWDWNVLTGEVYYNRRWAEMIGYDIGEIQPHYGAWLDRVHPEDMTHIAQALQLHWQGRTPFYQVEHRLQDKSGEWKWILTSGRVVARDESGAPSRAAGTHLDVTERRRAEQALQESLARLARTEAFSSVMVAHVGLDGRWLKVTPTFCNLLGYTEEEILSRTIQDLTHPDELEADVRERQRLLDGQAKSFDIEKRLLRRDGSVVWVDVNCSVVLDAESRPVQFVTYTRDITERKQTEEALRESETRYRALCENSGVGIWQITPEGYTLYANPAVCGMLEIDGPGELVGVTFHGFLTSESLETVRRHHALRAQNQASTYEAEIVGKRGTRRNVLISGAPLVSANGQLQSMIASVVDITELRRLESQLHLADRLSSVGTLAAGVAHEINNPLTYIGSNLEYSVGALDSLSRGGSYNEWREIEAALREAIQGANRVRNIVADLKTFSRSDEQRPGPVDVHRVLDVALRITGNELRHRVRLIQTRGEIPLVLGTESRLAQVFVNLLVNAMQAMPDRDSSENEVRVSTRASGGKVYVEVEDNGNGMPREVLSRIFDPFFTTKPVGTGTGLGLAVCHGIIASLGGDLRVHSEVGKGSAFCVVLPAADAREFMGELVIPAGPARRGRILIVDDEPFVLSTVRRMLTSEHDLVTASGGEEALSHLRADSFDVVLCDLQMPEMSGMDFYEEASRMHPTLRERFLFLTGGAFTTEAARFAESQRERVIEKPVDMRRLRELLQRFLAPS